MVHIDCQPQFFPRVSNIIEPLPDIALLPATSVAISGSNFATSANLLVSGFSKSSSKTVSMLPSAGRAAKSNAAASVGSFFLIIDSS